MSRIGQTPIVSVISLTYNHAPYIRECLDGFLMQKTDFPFEVIIQDDASTDGTTDIIREYAAKYPDIIKPIIQTENQYSKHHDFDKILKGCFDKSKGKYIAMCEGDDYWIDPLKLQKQVDFLESHPDCSLVCSNYDILYQKNKKIKAQVLKKTGKATFNDLIIDNIVATNTAVFRVKILAEYKNFISGAPKWSFGDYPMWLYAATKGYIFIFNETMSIYRRLEHSASHGLDHNAKLSWIRSQFSVFDFFDNNFEIPNTIRQKALYKLCHDCRKHSILLKDAELINRIRNFYWSNRYYSKWLSFIILTKYLSFRPIRNMTEHRQYY